MKTANLLEEELKKSGFKYYESLLPEDQQIERGELVVISEKTLDEEELYSIRNEKRESDEKETELLRSCLILRLILSKRLFLMFSE